MTRARRARLRGGGGRAGARLHHEIEIFLPTAKSTNRSAMEMTLNEIIRLRRQDGRLGSST